MLFVGLIFPSLVSKQGCQESTTKSSVSQQAEQIPTANPQETKLQPPLLLPAAAAFTF